MKTILVATDFSDASVNAGLYAVQLARDLEANILLMHVNIPEESFQQAAVVEKSQRAMTGAEIQLENLRNKMHNHGGGEVQIDTDLIIGDFSVELYNLCERINPYLVIMGSQGTSATERFLLGSNSVHAMRNLKYPLITVPVGASYSPIRRIGLASDFDQSFTSLPLVKIKDFLSDFNASMHIINVGKNREFSAKVISESTTMREFFKDKNPEYHFITNENTEEGIMDCAEQNRINLLMVFPRQYGFLDQLFHKSMSKQLVLRSKIPVIILHPVY